LFLNKFLIILKDESGYDDKNWKKIKKAIEKNRLSNRRKFDD
jgi:hypothetical protein